MAGYTRQSAASIITTGTITAAPLNNEFNALADAFNATTGHTHSGGTGDGPKLPITSMADIADMKVMGNVSGSLGAVGPVAVLDEDDMTSNSATSLVTQQSVKAYVDNTLPISSGFADAAEVSATNSSNSAGDALTYSNSASSSKDAALVSENNSSVNNTYAQEWANKVEDSAVSIAAGGDGSSTFSALHWAAKAYFFAQSANVPDYATEIQALDGTATNVIMNPLRAKQATDAAIAASGTSYATLIKFG